jgi:hypothetical protein
MPRRSKIEGLPKTVKEWLDGQLVEGNFAGYQTLAAELKTRGYDISKSGLHRYGQIFEERLQTLKLVTEQARAVVAASPDDEDAVNQALVRLTQEKLFGLLMELEVNPATVNLSGITRSIAELARASINVKDFAAKVRTKAEAAANSVASSLKQAGLTDEAVSQIQSRILGIAS